MNNKRVFLILFAIVVLGLGLRAYKLGAPVFVTDEFLDINASYGYHKTGQWLAWDFNSDRVSDNLYAPRDERAWLYRWQVAQLFHWFPPTEAVARSISVAWGVVSIILIYFVGKYFTGKKEIGLLASFLFAVSTLGISIDRTLRMYAMLMPVFLLFSWFLFRFFEDEYRGKITIFKKIYERLGLNIIWLVPALIFGIISLHIHDLAANIGVALFAYLLLRSLGLFQEKKSFFNKYSAALLLLLLGLIAFYFFPPANSPKYFSAIKFFNFESKYIFAAVKDYTNYILAYGLIFWGIFSLFKKSKDGRAALWLSCMFFAILGPAFLVWNYVFGDRLIFFILPFGIILLASGVYYLASFLRENSIKFKNFIFAGVLIIIMIILPSYAYFFEKKEIYKEQEGPSNYRKIFNYIHLNSRPGDVLFARNFRSYYYANSALKVYDLDSYKKISLSTLTKAMSQNPRVWATIEKGDGGFSKEALALIKNEFEVQKTINGVSVYSWKK